jgi:hypothetical protein
VDVDDVDVDVDVDVDDASDMVALHDFLWLKRDDRNSNVLPHAHVLHDELGADFILAWCFSVSQCWVMWLFLVHE